jgi:hypothetical protein
VAPPAVLAAAVTVNHDGAAVMVNDDGTPMVNDDNRFFDRRRDSFGLNGERRDRRGVGQPRQHTQSQRGDDGAAMKTLKYHGIEFQRHSLSPDVPSNIPHNWRLRRST